jgi:exodeoxyribonuclease VII large subunit
MRWEYHGPGKRACRSLPTLRQRHMGSGMDPLIPFDSASLVESSTVDVRKNAPTVSQLTRRLRGHVENTFFDVWVRGEISGFRKPSSGHAYFVLKDAGASLRVCIFRPVLSKIRFAIEDGMEILLHGRLTVYEPRGEYQLVADAAEPVGTGALQLAFEQLKEKLSKEGLFDPQHKKALPLLPKRIGVITSPTGAAVHDIIQVLHRRFPNREILIFPSSVQGDRAAGEIVLALDRVQAWNRQNPDRTVEVILIGRGGGSLEDLWPFNEESVARALHACPIPTISAVGHETDFTIADFVADLRAPTPSAAAEIVLPKREELFYQVQTLQKQLVHSLRKSLDNKRLHVSHLSRRIVSPVQKLAHFRKQADFLSERLRRAMQTHLQHQKHRMASLAEKLHVLSPLSILGRGFTLTTLENGKIVRSASSITKQTSLCTRFPDGIVISEVVSQKPIPG